MNDDQYGDDEFKLLTRERDLLYELAMGAGYDSSWVLEKLEELDNDN